MPAGCFVIFLAKGTKKYSYSGMRMDMKRRGMTGIDGAGTLMEPKWRSMMLPCWTENVWSCAKQVFIMMVLKRIGNILVRTFTSSTCVTVQAFHGSGLEPLPSMAALSRQLIQYH
ncbi:hypothetical protein ACFXTH_033247 [Malus domestica]